jgi:ATP-binding cassette subfamily B protein
MTTGTLTSLFSYVMSAMFSLMMLAAILIMLTMSAASADRITEVLVEEPDIVNPEHPLYEVPDGSIRFDNVHFTYKKDGEGEENLHDIDLDIRSGETIGIIGGTGSGKTSLINLIPRFYDASEGTVSVLGHDVREWSSEALRDRIGIVPQKAVLFAGTVRENMLWGNENATDDDINRALEIAQAAGVVADKGGLDARIEQGGKNLSGGQRQRLTIARALVKDPDVLILDDSASALDFATDAALRAAIRGIGGYKTVFIISQRASSIMHADKIIVLEDGCAEGVGTHADLLKTSDVYREIYASQFKKEVE